VATALVVGRRRSPDVVVLVVRAAAMAEAGHVFHRSENGVWLTAAVPAAFLDEQSE
jgi:putative RNA 2'-phosphotransferase